MDKRFVRQRCHWAGGCVLAIVVLLLIVNDSISVADVPARNSSAEAILGEWRIVEMVHKGKVQDLSLVRGGAWIKLEKEHFAISYRGRVFFTKYPCRVAEGVLTIEIDEHELKARYDYRDDKLRIIWRHDYGERPASFEAVGDASLTLYVLKRAED